MILKSTFSPIYHPKIFGIYVGHREMAISNFTIQIEHQCIQYQAMINES